MRSFEGSGGSMSSRRAPNTPLNWASYRFSSSSNRRVRSFRDARIRRSRTNARMISTFTGRISTVDLYADPRLFRKLAPRLLESAALEAASATPTRRRPPPAGRVESTLVGGRKGMPRVERLGPDLESVVRESPRVVGFICRYRGVDLHEQTVCK